MLNFPRNFLVLSSLLLFACVKTQSVKVSATKPLSVNARKAPELLAAEELLQKGLVAYQQGAYTEAEGLAKAALLVYPSLPAIHLLLAKIFLMQGAANQDSRLLGNAKHMLEMARSLAPDLREVDTLLQLFD